MESLCTVESIGQSLTKCTIVYQLPIVQSGQNTYIAFQMYNSGVWSSHIERHIIEYCKTETDEILSYWLKGGKVYQG